MSPVDRHLLIALVVHGYNRHEGRSRYAAEQACRFARGHDS